MKRLIAAILLLATCAFGNPLPTPGHVVFPSVVGLTDPVLMALANRYASYYFYLLGLTDRANRAPLTFARASQSQDSNGNTLAINEPDITAGMVRVSPVVENLFLLPAAPETQSITLGAGTYTMSCTGTGSVEYDSNTATPGNPVTFTLGGSTTDNATVTGSLTSVQITESSYRLPTNTSGSASAVESLTATMANHPKLVAALMSGGNGYWKYKWQPMFSQGDLGEDFDILTCGNLTVKYDDVNSQIELYDGTNTAYVSYAAVGYSPVWVHLDWDWASDTMRIGYSTTENGTVTWGDTENWIASFLPGDELDFPEGQYIGSHRVTGSISSYANSIGIPGQQDFGVGVYPGTLPDGFSELTGTTTPGHDNYGNYAFQDGSIVCWIPAFWYKIGTGSNGFPVNQISVKPYTVFSDEATANAAGYGIHRAFIDGGETHPGFFFDKYMASKNALGTGYVASSIKNGNPISTASDHNPIADLTACDSNNYYQAINAAKARDGENGEVSADPQWHCASRFQYACLAMLSMAHGQYAISDTYCAWYDATGAKNYPKGNNSNALSDTDDSAVTFTSDGYANNSAKTGSGAPLAKTTHNGQNCGVTDLNGNMWEVSIGMTCIAAAKSIEAINQANPAVVTITDHGYETGDYAMITSISAGDWANLADKMYQVTVIDEDTFSLDGVDTSGFGTAYIQGTNGGSVTTGKWYAAKDSVAMKDFSSGNSLATDHWGATGVAAMMDEFTPAFEVGYPNNGFAQRYGSGSNQVLDNTPDSVSTALGLPMAASGIDTTGTNLFGKDYFYQYARNEMGAISGGYWSSSLSAGVWNLYWNSSRTHSNSFVGFRCACYPGGE